MKLKRFILITLAIFLIFVVVMPLIFDLPLFSMVFCVDNNTQIINSILSHPIRLINILAVYYSASAYCGPFILTNDMIINMILYMFLPQLLVSLLIGFLYIKSFPLQSPKRKFYLTSFFAVIIFLIIRSLKNHFASPFVLEWGGDPLVLLTPQYTLQQAIMNASLYGPSALVDRTDPQTKMIAINISIAVDFVVSIIGGYILALLIQKKNKKYSTNKK